MLGFCPLSSGSKGNCIYFGSQKAKILIDAGISYSAIESKLSEIDVDIKQIDAVLVTHEHVDHISGLKVLCERLNIPVFCNSSTAKGICDALKIRPRFRMFTTGETFQFADLEIRPFSVPHDTLEPVAFTIQAEGLKVGFCADLGHVTSLVKNELKCCDFLYVEANHQPSMVHASSRPYIYKQRVLSRQGHLSNEECACLLVDIWHEGIKHVFLAHLSAECNQPELALKIVQEALEKYGAKPSISIAHQESISKKILF